MQIRALVPVSAADGRAEELTFPAGAAPLPLALPAPGAAPLPLARGLRGGAPRVRAFAPAVLVRGPGPGASGLHSGRRPRGLRRGEGGIAGGTRPPRLGVLERRPRRPLHDVKRLQNVSKNNQKRDRVRFDNPSNPDH